MNREVIQALAKRLPRGTGGESALVPLAKKNDPFMTGTPTERAMGEWFVELWETMGYQAGKHVRDIHYDIATKLDYTYHKHDGSPYVHTKACYTYMQNAARVARHLGLLDDVLDDNRSDPVKEYLNERSEYFGGSREPDYETEFDEGGWELPSISISDAPAFPFPAATVRGYDYHHSDQPVHVEVWSEKIKAKPQLEGVCSAHHANLQWGMGGFGIEVCRDLVDRAKKWKKPCRVLYLCDYDPAGIWMPISVGRQVEYILSEADEHELDITVEVLGVTTDQIVELDLPRKPFEEKEHKWARTRDENFEKHLGEGGTELNAIGDYELAEVVEERILLYRDEGLRAAVADAEAAAEEALNRAIGAAEADFSGDIEALSAEVGDVRARYASLVEKLNARMRRELQQAYGRRANLRELVQGRLDELDVELPEYPEGEPAVPFENDHYLYDSFRTYLVQMRHYRRRQGREEEWDAVLAALADEEAE